MNGYSSESQSKLEGLVSFTHMDDLTSQGAFHHRQRLKAYELILKIIGNQERIVDVGCSRGDWSLSWRDFGIQFLVGADPNRYVQKEAESKLDAFYPLDAVNLSNFLSEEPFIVANAVVIHILSEGDLSEFYQAINRMLAKTGYFVVSFVNPERYLGSRTYGNFGDTFSMYTVEKNISMLQKNGFEVLKLVGSFIEPWSTVNLEFLADESSFPRDSRLWQPFELLGDLLRGSTYSEFTEIFAICQRTYD
jgi:ubiquinone/menaquinone biosynthesis C-methylase UbiE